MHSPSAGLSVKKGICLGELDEAVNHAPDGFRPASRFFWHQPILNESLGLGQYQENVL